MEEEDIIDPEALPPKLFECSLCPSAFTRNASRTRHYREVHKNIGANGEQLAPPIANIPPKLYYSCLICAKSFNKKSSRDMHFEKIHNRDKNAKKEPEQNLVSNFQCDICDEEFIDETIFLNHKSLHSTYLLRSEQNDCVYECEICEREFSTNRSRARHYWLVHNGAKILEQAEEMSHTEITKSKSPPPPKLEDSGNEPPPTVDDSEDETKNKYPCFICSKSYAKNFNRFRHIQRVHNGVVVSTEGLRVYKKGRAGRNGQIKFTRDINPYKIYYPCDICGCVFMRNFARERHYQNIHNGKRHYIEVHSGVEDDSAPNATQSKSVVVRSRQTNYPCIICKKIYFTTYKRRERHYKNVHNGAKLVSTIDKSDKYILEGHKIIYPCAICNVVFARKQHLDRHSREGHHGNRSLRIEKGCSGIRPADVVTIDNGFQCDACGVVFDSHLFLVRHKSMKAQDMNGELKQAHAVGSSSLSALQVITDDSQSVVVTYIHDDANGGHIAEVNDAYGGHIGSVNDTDGGHFGAVNEQLPAVGLAVKNDSVESVVIDDDEPHYRIGERHYRTIHEGARTLDEIAKRGMMLSVAHMRQLCDICGDAFDSKLMLESHKSSEHATNKGIPNAAFSGTAKLNDEIDSEVAVKQEDNTDLLLHIVKEEYEVYEKSFSKEIVSDNVKNEEDSNDEPANNSYLGTTENWQYI